jgi:hypothetical protein
MAVRFFVGGKFALNDFSRRGEEIVGVLLAFASDLEHSS